MTKAELKSGLYQLASQVPYNSETRGFLDDLYPILKKHFHSQELDTIVREKKGDPLRAAGAKKSAKVWTTRKHTPEDFQKKTSTSQQISPVKAVESPKPPEPVQAAKEPSNEEKIFELYTAGIAAAQEAYPKPGQLKKAIKEIGVESEGKSWDDHWSALQEAFNKMNA